jgi:hypothetical protein
MDTGYLRSSFFAFDVVMALFDYLWLAYSLLVIYLVVETHYSIPGFNPCLYQSSSSHDSRMGISRGGTHCKECASSNNHSNISCSNNHLRRRERTHIICLSAKEKLFFQGARILLFFECTHFVLPSRIMLKG